MVQNILFDLDETLLDFKRSESRALSNMLRHIGVEPTEKVISRYSEINKSRWKLLEQGLLTRQQVKESRYEILFAELGVEYSAAEATAYYEDQLSQKEFVFPDTIKLLETLHGRYRMYIVSNGGSNVQSGRFEKVYSITRTSDGRYRYEVDRKFRDYDTPEEGIRDHAKVLSAKRYAVAWAYRNDITRFAYEIAKAGYCTAEPAAYADLISKIARMIERA